MQLWMTALTALAAPADANGAWDHAYRSLDEVYADAVDARGVDYDRVATRRPTLDAWIADASRAPLEGFDRDQTMSFWINTYNALTIAVVLDAGPPDSIRDIDSGQVWSRRSFVVAGQQVTLNDIEHRRLRPMGDPRVHAALNCASVGCPPLPSSPVRAASLDRDLDAACRGWVRHNAFEHVGQRVALSKIFKWYGEDFVVAGGPTDKQQAARAFLARFADDTQRAVLLDGTIASTWAPYDWSLNRRPAAGSGAPSSAPSPSAD